MRRLIGLVVTVTVVWAALVLLASRSLYFPLRDGDWTAGSRVGAKDVWVRPGLHGWLARAPGSLATLHLHGNGGNITHRVSAARHIVEAGSSVLLLDYRGYGRSEGRPTERGLYEDAELAFDWLVRAGFERVVVHGESLGSAVAVELATRRKCAGLVLEAPFTSARAMAGRVLPLIGPLVMWGYDSKSKIGRAGVPVFVIHGDEDDVVAYELGQKLFEAAPEPKRMWTVRGAMHNDLHYVGAGEFVERLREFYAELR